MGSPSAAAFRGSRFSVSETQACVNRTLGMFFGIFRLVSWGAVQADGTERLESMVGEFFSKRLKDIGG